MLILSLVLRCWKLCAATAASHRLAYEWAQAHNTKVGRLLCFFRREGRSSDNTYDCPIFDNYRTPTRMITVLLRRDGTTNCCRYLAKIPLVKNRDQEYLKSKDEQLASKISVVTLKALTSNITGCRFTSHLLYSYTL